jgi:hypothetical protein
MESERGAFSLHAVLPLTFEQVIRFDKKQFCCVEGAMINDALQRLFA